MVEEKIIYTITTDLPCITSLIQILVRLLNAINEDISFTVGVLAAHKLSTSDIFYDRHCFPRGGKGFFLANINMKQAC